MSFYDYLPTIISLLLIVTTRIGSLYFANHIGNYQFGEKGLQKNKLAVKNIALDWGNRQAFLGSMVAAFFALFSVFSKARHNWIGGIAVVLIFVVLVTIFLWAMGRRPGEWEDHILLHVPLGSDMSIKVTRAGLCNLVLIVVNISVLIVLLLSEPDIRTAEQITTHMVP